MLNNLDDIRALLPLKGNLTQEIIDTSKYHNPLDCPGRNTLKAALGELGSHIQLTWAGDTGTVYDKNIHEWIILTTVQKINFMRSKPTEVDFVMWEYI